MAAPDKPFPIQKSDITYGADLMRRLLEAQTAVGVFGLNDFKIEQKSGGANKSVDVLSGEGVCAFTSPDGEKYYVRNGTTRVNSGTPGAPNTSEGWATTFVEPDATNPRLDAVVLQVRDSNLDAGGAYDQVYKVVGGTATSGATLDNRTGAAAIPANTIHLADVLVRVGATDIVTADIRDRRPFGLPGVVPPLLTDVDMVGFVGHPGVKAPVSVGQPVDLRQAALAVFLPRRIVGATRIRWNYDQGATALTGNYVIAIYDASGRKIVDTGSVAYTGAANSEQNRSETIAATTFEAGWYYLLFGHDSTNAGTITYLGWDLTSGGGGGPNVVGYQNIGLYSLGSGVTAPTTVLGMTEIVTGGTTSTISVPVIALSVG